MSHSHTPFNIFTELNHARLADESARRFGFYSPRQASNVGTAVWRTPEGERVTVTAVYDRAGVPPESGYHTDSVLVGEVVECVSAEKSHAMCRG